MPKVITDDNQRKVACNVSLPLGFIKVIDEYVRGLKSTFGDQLPKTFSRSDVLRVMVDRYLYTPYVTKTGKRFTLDNSDDNKLMLTLDIGVEYGLVKPNQLDLFSDDEEEPEPKGQE